MSTNKKESIRRVDVDPFFDNTRLDLTKEGFGGKKRVVPYHVGNTWRKVSSIGKLSVQILKILNPFYSQMAIVKIIMKV